MFLEKFLLVCFDFDGLLVDTEPLHHRAYTQAAQNYGFPLDLDFSSYKELSHNPTPGLLERYMRHCFPKFTTPWEEFRSHAKQIYRSLLQKEGAPLMPGAKEVLCFVKEKGISFCVVTNSVENEVGLILPHHPSLQTVPLWITREKYRNPKPSPDGYLTARAHFPNIPQEKIVGLEDTLRGVEALKGAHINPVFIGESCPPLLGKDEYYFPSLTSMVI